MKKKLQTVATLMVGSLLLTGCDIPKSLLEFVGWRSKFFLNVDESMLDRLLGPLLAFLMACAAAVALIGLISNLKSGRPVWSGTYLTGLGLMLGVTSVYVYIPVASSIGEKVFPVGLTLEKVFEAMHWELTANLAEIASAGWGISVTLILPLISSFWQIVMLLAAIAAIMGSIVGRTLKGVVFAYSQIFGWLLFLVMYDTFVTYIGLNYPEWDSAAVAVFMSLFYTAIVFVLLTGCYIGIPWMAFHLTPEPTVQVETDRIRESHSFSDRARGVLDAAFAVPVFIPTDFDDGVRRRGRNDSYEVVEGEIIDEEMMEQYYLPSPDTSSRNGSDETEPTSPSSPGPVNPSKPSGPSNSGNSGDSVKSSRRDVNFGGRNNFGPTARVDELDEEGEPRRSAKVDYSEYYLPDMEPEPPKKKSAYSKIAPKVERAAKLVEVAGVLTGKPDVVLAGKAVEAVNRVAEEVDSREEGKTGVIKRQIKEGLSRVISDQLTEDLSAYFLPEEYLTGGTRERQA